MRHIVDDNWLGTGQPRAASQGPNLPFLPPQLATRAARARFRLQVKLQSKYFLIFHQKAFAATAASNPAPLMHSKVVKTDFCCKKAILSSFLSLILHDIEHVEKSVCKCADNQCMCTLCTMCTNVCVCAQCAPLCATMHHNVHHAQPTFCAWGVMDSSLPRRLADVQPQLKPKLCSFRFFLILRLI